MPKIIVFNFGQLGVNVDNTDLHLDNAELRQAQNISSNPLGNTGGIKKRPGLAAFNATAAAGSISGGIVVILDNNLGASSFLLLGREEA